MSSQVESARPEDAVTLQRMLTTVFTANFIGYTIYQSPQSANFLRKLIEDPECNFIRVIREQDEIVAFCQSSLQETSSHLGFIGVAPGQQGRGLANVLLDDLSEFTRSSRRKKVTLDVFEDNEKPYHWYQKRGFEETDRYLLARLKLAPFVGKGTLEIEDLDLEAALKNEAEQGFGNLCAEFQGRWIELGLIGGRRLRIRDKGPFELEDLVPPVAGSFAATREALIMSTKNPPFPDDMFESRDVTLRMELAV